MNASDIVEAKQNKTLFQAYYRPTIFPGTSDNQNTLIVSSINYYPVSSINGGTSSQTSCNTINYLYTCNQPFISYELANDVNSGKYLCGYPTCSSISIWNTEKTVPAGVCSCRISYLTWKNTTSTTVYQYSTINYSSINITSTTILTGPSPLICPDPEFYQGTNFASRCETCCNIGSGINACCTNCASGK